MASAWGSSWGTCWGDSWGASEAAVVEEIKGGWVDPHALYNLARKRKKPDELEEIDFVEEPTPVEARDYTLPPMADFTAEEQEIRRLKGDIAAFQAYQERLALEPQIREEDEIMILLMQ